MINNPFQMVVFIVLIVMVGSVLKARYDSRAKRMERPQDDAEKIRLKEELGQLKDRLAVLERITIEKENSLERQIEELRDR